MWLFLCVIVVFVNSILIYLAIRKQERRNEKYLAAQIQKQTTTSSTTRRPRNSSNCEVSQLSLPHFDFVDLGPLNSTDAADNQVNVPDDLMSSNMKCFHDSTTSPSTVNEDQIQDERTLQPHCSSAAVKESPIEPISAIDELPPTEGPNTDLSMSASSIPPQTMANSNQRCLKQSRMAATQSSCYICSVLFLAVWTFFPWVGYKLQVAAPMRFFFAFMTNAVGPAQGFLNLLIFVRLQYVHLRETKKNDWSRIRCFRHSLFSSA
jgi:hypothetical protein